MTKTKRTRQGGRQKVRLYRVPQAGAMVGLTRSASYSAAARGQIPTLRFGRLLKVPAELWDRILRGEARQDPARPSRGE
jgi:hypothetical protein